MLVCTKKIPQRGLSSLRKIMQKNVVVSALVSLTYLWLTSQRRSREERPPPPEPPSLAASLQAVAAASGEYFLLVGAGAGCFYWAYVSYSKHSQWALEGLIRALPVGAAEQESDSGSVEEESREEEEGPGDTSLPWPMLRLRTAAPEESEERYSCCGDQEVAVDLLELAEKEEEKEAPLVVEEKPEKKEVNIPDCDVPKAESKESDDFNDSWWRVESDDRTNVVMAESDTIVIQKRGGPSVLKGDSIGKGAAGEKAGEIIVAPPPPLPPKRQPSAEQRSTVPAAAEEIVSYPPGKAAATVKKVTEENEVDRASRQRTRSNFEQAKRRFETFGTMPQVEKKTVSSIGDSVVDYKMSSVGSIKTGGETVSKGSAAGGEGTPSPKRRLKKRLRMTEEQLIMQKIMKEQDKYLKRNPLLKDKPLIKLVIGRLLDEGMKM